MFEYISGLSLFHIVVYSLYIIDILFLFFYGIHCYFMIFMYTRNASYCDAKKYRMRSYPFVTVQLPIYNEALVVERLIRSSTQIDYPKDRFEIQVLDDSNDETYEIVKKLVRFYRRQKYNIKHIHRTNRVGHKAGALREGMDKAKGEFLAVFDADFIPAKSFLKKTVPYFRDPNIGMVQARWGHVNADYSLLTKAQSIGVDGHFLVEQVARNCNDLFMNFNGTAGIWRKQCIMDAGNWSADTLTEDFDLSYRAELAGWKFQYIQDVVNPAELPAHISAYKSQQFRWAKGSIQTALKLIPRILLSPQRFIVKIEAVVHLTNYLVHPLMLVNVLLGLPIIILSKTLTEQPMIMTMAAFLSIATFGPTTFYLFSLIKLYPGDWKRRAAYLPLMLIIGSGISLNNARAFFEAVIGRKTPFIRTPKINVESAGESYRKIRYTVPIGIDTVLEAMLGLYALTSAYIALAVGNYLIAPFLFIYAGGFLYVSLLAVKQHVLGLAVKPAPAMATADGD